MLFKVLRLGLLATAVTAVPTTGNDLELAHGDMHVFKRESILEPRDVELAKIHGVNLTSMYKHSMIKRDDGDHITIWIDNGFVEVNDDEADEDLAKRQNVRIAPGAQYKNSLARDWCADHIRNDHTGPNGPFSGGVQAIYRWAGGRDGYFSFGDESYSDQPGTWRDFIIAGSNSGANAVYKARLTGKPHPNWHERGVGTFDIRDDADWTQHKARKFGSSYRASSRGEERCGMPGEGRRRVLYEILRTSQSA